MPELLEQMYCSQQIVIPPKFPYILKRYCKAAIKTQPYDLLRWSFEYFRALSERRAPPVKLRLEYPIYSTEGGLTRGCLKVLANQLAGQEIIPLTTAKAAWQGFCLDPEELLRVFCLCEVYDREDSVPYAHLIAVIAGLLTKSLTHTMILLCETLTKEPDGGSAAIPVNKFLKMYKYLARMDASKDVRYINGYREGWTPPVEEPLEEEVEPEEDHKSEKSLEDDYWQGSTLADLQKLSLVNDHVARSTNISSKLNQTLIGEIERSPSVERAANIERECYMLSRKGAAKPDDNVDEKLKALSVQLIAMSKGEMPTIEAEPKKVTEVEDDQAIGVTIHVFDEDENEVPFVFYGQPPIKEEVEGEEDENEWDVMDPLSITTDEKTETGEETITERLKILKYVQQCIEERNDRRQELQETFDEVKALVEKYKNANYDLGMVAGRQMSITSGEFIVNSIEKEIMEYIDEQIAILPDPDLKKKKAKPEEVAMIREILETFLDENMYKIIPEIEVVEEEEEPVPEIVTAYAVPGIGPPVDDDTIRDFEEYAYDVTKVQADLFMPRNIRHFMCPPLEKYHQEHHYDEDYKRKKNEELTTGGGTIAD